MSDPRRLSMRTINLLLGVLLLAGVVLFSILYKNGGAIKLAAEIQAEADAQAAAQILPEPTPTPVAIAVSTKGRLLPYLENGLWGYKSASGEIVILPRYTHAKEFDNDVGFAAEGGLYGLITRSGAWLVPPIWSDVLPFSEGMAAVEFDGKWGFIDRDGNQVIDYRFREVGGFSCGRAVARTASDYGYIDILGNMAISEKFGAANRFADDLAFVTSSSGNSRYIIDKLGQPQVTLNAGTHGVAFSEGFAVITSGSFAYYMNDKAETAFKSRYDDALPFAGGFAAVKDQETGLWGYINTRGAYAIRPAYQGASSFSNYYAAVQDAETGLWGYINVYGELKIPCKYDEAQPFLEGHAIALLGREYFIVDKDGGEAPLYTLP